MDEMNAAVEVAAKAICAATPSGRLFPWDELSEKDRDAWRHMAQAAIEALGLSEERAILAQQVIGMTVSDLTVPVAILDDERATHWRLAGTWRIVESHQREAREGL